MATDLPGFGRIAFNTVGSEVTERGVLHAASLTAMAKQVLQKGQGTAGLRAAIGRLQTSIGVALYGYTPATKTYSGRLLTINDVPVDEEGKGWAALVCDADGHAHKTPRLIFVRGVSERPADLVCDKPKKKQS